MSKEASSGLGSGVRSRFGPVSVPDGAGGVVRTAGGMNQVVLEFSGADINNDDFQKAIVPAGSFLTRAYIEVEEIFALGGTTPTIDIGTDGSEATNRVDVTQAQAQAVGTYDIVSTALNTWAARLAADTTVSIALGGTTPTVTSAGKGRVVLEFVKV
jgi:hypothetical protein